MTPVYVPAVDAEVDLEETAVCGSSFFCAAAAASDGVAATTDVAAETTAACGSSFSSAAAAVSEETAAANSK